MAHSISGYKFKAKILLNLPLYVLKNLRKYFSAIYRQNNNLLFQPSIEAAYKSAPLDNPLSAEQEIKKLKDELSLLHNQLFYERHRREIFGLRNR